MNTHTIGRPATRALVVVLLASGAAFSLAACQSPPAPAVPAPIERSTQRPLDRTLIEKYGIRTADRMAEAHERAIKDGQLPTPDCINHHLVEHPDGGYHLVCVQPRD